MDQKKTDTHFYDYKLKDDYNNFLNTDKKYLIQPINFDKTLEEILNKIKTFPMNNTTITAFKSLVLFNNDRINNYDKSNEIKLEQLLPLTWRFVKNYDRSGFYLFIEQLADIFINGKCAQGRNIRIYQFYHQHMVLRDDIYKKYLITE